MVPVQAALVAILIAFLGPSQAACNRSPSAGTTEGKTTGATAGSAAAPSAGDAHSGRGVIKAFGEGRKTVKIAHEDIPNYMKAMTMPFGVTSPAVLDGLAEGDAVDFSFVESNDGRLVIQTIKKR